VWVVCLFVSVSKQVSELLRRTKAIRHSASVCGTGAL